MTIPAFLIYIVRKRKDVPFSFLFWLFGLFILSCGFTHFMGLIVTYYPMYRLDGVIKLITAIASWGTVFALFPVIKRAMLLRSPEQLEEEVKKRTEELAAVNAALAEANESLKRADQQKNDFLAMLGHELRNPLAPLRTGVDVMKMTKSVDMVADMMERQIAQLTRLVDDLLDVSRIIRGQVTLHKAPIAICGAIEIGIEAAQPIINKRRHTLEREFPSHPIWVNADTVRLAQCVTNLLTNAAKYTEEGGHILVSVKEHDGFVEVSVKDNGIGIPQGMLGEVFKLFVQGQTHLSRTNGGLGLGLTIVKHLVEMHDGTVEARSEGTGKGSEFVVRMPTITMPVEEKPPIPESSLGVGKKRILLIDDNEDAILMLRAFLEIQGHNVISANTGEQGVILAERHRPDVLFVDIGLPGISGFEVAAALRAKAEFTNTPMAAITGYGQPEDRRRCLEAGFDCHFVKPVDTATISAFVSSPSFFKAKV